MQVDMWTKKNLDMGWRSERASLLFLITDVSANAADLNSHVLSPEKHELYLTRAKSCSTRTAQFPVHMPTPVQSIAYLNPTGRTTCSISLSSPSTPFPISRGFRHRATSHRLPMETMGDLGAALDASPTSDPAAKNGAGAATDASRIAEVKAWLASQFEAAGRDVPAFEYTPRNVAHLHSLASLSQARSRAASIVAADLRLKASEYRAEAARIREVLERVGLAREQLSPGAIGSAQVVAGVANLLNIRDTEMSSFVVAMGDLSLRKADVEDKRAKVQKESKVLLEYTRKAIAKLNDLKK
ncbi:hypothetical protein B296_00005389 [Ensete ventricosum]|uniref:Uncharacterized protein n=1 Tax=Ensete ventricosum TaxID=4639 RepID=A0A427AC91_ENSVE|nr:hypothetical protein B296_00005389 [Ensete ventricosum]